MFRIIYRITLLVLWTGILYLPLLLAVLLPPWNAHARYIHRGRVVKLWCRGVARVIGMRMSVTGTPPEAPFIMVANHLGYLDIILLSAHLPCFFLSKSDVRQWPVLGVIMQSSNVLYITRENKKDLNRVSEEMMRVVNNGCGLIFFPEGTSTRGREVIPFKSSLFKVAAENNIPVHHAVLRYETPANGPHPENLVCWWGDDPFGPHVLNLLRAPHFSAFLAFGGDAIMRNDRKELARDLHHAVSAAFKPVSQETQ